ncbi:hypothetical protein [Roseofilum sp. Belize Diploria]|uniref:hypothetical protein n=1 Tax=Roseofilum sp. Belize Diploria TaxID=2821501 RepID=UPI001B1D1B8F|nr:hypothetical protein [Roseofilum sp. Belize Diploria]MBP0008065.1 hypothetical protein [Roseofilum sp. Belize Diploria]
MKRIHILAAIASIGVSSAIAFFALRPKPVAPVIPAGQALRELASPQYPDPEWLVRSDWLLTKFCSDAQGRAIATDDPSNCAGSPAARSTDDSLNQLLLWTERHRKNSINLESQRFISEAIRMTNTPGHPCHQKSLDFCYVSFEENLKQDLAQETDPSEVARLVGKAQALAIARSGISPKVAALSKTQILQGIERFSQDLQIAKSAGIDGAIELSRDIQEALKQEEIQ